MTGSTTTRRWIVAAMRSLSAAALVGALCASSAEAAGTWLTPTGISSTSPSSIGSNPRIAVGRDGTAWTAYTRSDGANYRAEVGIRPAGSGVFTEVRQLSAAGGNASAATIKVDRQGNATAAWLRSSGAVQVVQAAFRPAGGDWGPPQDLSDITITVSNLELALGDNGHAVVVWQRMDATVPRVEASIRPAGSPIFGSRTFISPATGSSLCAPQVAMDPAGNVVALWQRRYDVGGGTLRWVMESNAKGVSNSWSLAGVQARSRTDLGDASSCTYDVAMTPNGRALAIWDYSNGTGTPGSLFVEYADRIPSPNFASGTWGSRQRASSPSQNGQIPYVALDEAGNAVGTWQGYNGSNYVVQGSVRQQLGAFSAPKDLSGSAPSAASIAVGPDGTAMITWAGVSGVDSAIFSARREPNGEFGDVRTAIVGTGTGNPRTFYTTPAVGVDDQGNAHALVVRRILDSGPPIVSAYSTVGLAFDAVAPTLADVSVPAAGTAGQAVTMSAASSDRISGSSLSWSFGDGAAATGPAVSHAYASPGVYTVTLTATDGAGNQNSTTRAIQIASGGGGTVQPAGIDNDKDGFFAGQDCNDGNAAIRPGALEVKGNRLDENCDGLAEPFPTLTSGVASKWDVKGNNLTLTLLQVTQQFPKGWKVQIKCTGKPKCSFKTKSLKAGKVKRGAATVITALSKKQRKFKAGQTVEVWVSAPNFNTKVARLALRKGKIPTTQPFCVLPGQTKVQKTCS